MGLENKEDPEEVPFRAIVRPAASYPTEVAGEDSSRPEESDVDEDADTLAADFSGDDIEAAYLRALEVTDAALEGVGEASPEETAAPDDPSGDPLISADSSSPAEPTPALAADAESPGSVQEVPRATSRQVVEALLFVGGAVLTSRKLAELLGEGFTNEQVEEIVDRLNADYAAESRPYAIHWGEGGYRYQLRPEFEKIRNRVFGVGPREVKLSQEALEILALVAYRQPLSSADLEATQRKNAGSILRQLIRRELVELRRSESAPDEPTYHTTPRFLELFGLTSLDDLPFPADFSFK
jgi:segregation and condensation protein B